MKHASLIVSMLCSIIGFNQSVYKLPFTSGSSFICSQGNNTTASHNGIEVYAFDFKMPIGINVTASRGGIVKEVTINPNWNDGNCPYTGSCSSNCVNNVNRIVIDHQDGTYGLYLHLTNTLSSNVVVGQSVQQGSPLAYSGNSGCSSGSHLHFMVMNNYPTWYQQSIPITFSDFILNNGVPVKTDLCTSGPSGKPINGNLDIYTGPKSSPHTDVKIWCYPPNGNSTFSITNFKINGNAKAININQGSQTFLNGKASFLLDFTNIIQGSSNGPYNFEFDSTSNNQTTHFYSTKLYFLDIDDYQDQNIKSPDTYAYKYIAQGTRNGLFKGSNITGNWLFSPDMNLTKGQAAKIVVNSMLQLGLLSGINNTGISPPPSSNNNSEFLPYLMTLYNKNSNIFPYNNGEFDVNQNINVEEFCWMLDNAFSLPNVPNIRNVISTITYNGTNAGRIASMKKIGNVFTENKDANGYTFSVESIASLFQYYSRIQPSL